MGLHEELAGLDDSLMAMALDSVVAQAGEASPQNEHGEVGPMWATMSEAYPALRGLVERLGLSFDGLMANKELDREFVAGAVFATLALSEYAQAEKLRRDIGGQQGA